MLCFGLDLDRCNVVYNAERKANNRYKYWSFGGALETERGNLAYLVTRSDFESSNTDPHPSMNPYCPSPSFPFCVLLDGLAGR
jgi:hypothetical protein